MTTKFDPKQHILVVRDATTGRHVHVAWDDVLNQLAEAPAQPIRVDLAPIMARLDAIEQLSESQLQVIASAVLEQIRLAGVKAA